VELIKIFSLLVFVFSLSFGLPFLSLLVSQRIASEKLHPFAFLFELFWTVVAGFAFCCCSIGGLFLYLYGEKADIMAGLYRHYGDTGVAIFSGYIFGGMVAFLVGYILKENREMEIEQMKKSQKIGRLIKSF
jgi:hypothetical protein